MAHTVEIKCFPIAKTTVDDVEIGQWLENLGCSERFIFQQQGLDIDDAERLVALAGKQCYMSFEVGMNPNVTKIRDGWAAYLDNILSSGHGSVLEHATWTWAICGITRVFTAEMNRHRAGVAISEQSLRYCRFDDIGYWLPDSLQYREDDNAELAAKKSMSLGIFEDVFEYIEKQYAALQRIWKINDIQDFATKKKLTSLFRRIVPLGVSVNGIWTMNLRALRHIITLRASEAAEEEILHVFTYIGKVMCSELGNLFGDFVQENGFWMPKYRKV